jgi:hypothetical protein
MISVARFLAGADSAAMEIFSAGDKSSCTVFKVSVMCIYKNSHGTTAARNCYGRRHRKVEKTSTIKRCSRVALGVEPGRCE